MFIFIIKLLNLKYDETYLLFVFNYRKQEQKPNLTSKSL